MQAGRTWRVWVLSAALLGGAVALAVALPRPQVSGTDAWLLPGLAVLIGAAEFLQVRYRLREEVDSSNLVEAVMTPLLVVAPNGLGVLAVAAGQLLAGGIRRNQPVKLCFNVAQWSFATAVGAEIWLATPGRDPASWMGLMTLVLAVLAVGLINLVAFTAVLVLLGSDLGALRAKLGLSWIAGLVVNTALGVLFALAHQATPYALLLVPVPLVVLNLSYRGAAAARADRARLVGMHRAASLLAEPLDPRPAIPAFLRAAAEVFDTRHATLVLRVAGGREVYTVDRDLEDVEVRCEAEDAVTLEAAMAAHPGAVRITAADPTSLGRALSAASHQDCLAAPIVESGRALGALLLLDQNGLDAGPGGQLAVLEALAREVAAALGKGRLLDSVLEERRKLSTVIGTTSDGIASFDAAGVVRSWNPAMTQITGLVESDVLGRAEGLSRVAPRTPQGEPVHLADWDGSSALPGELTVRRTTGERRRLACSWSRAEDSEDTVLVLVARDVTPAQEFEALRAEFGRLVEQEAARRLVVEQLQAAVVPATPVIEGLELAVNYIASDPKEPTGGDLWDWQVLPNGEVHLAVVDVLGHGVAATKSALAVVHTLRFLALDDTPLEDIVGRAAHLLERQDEELVATVVICRLDPVTGRLRIVSGGHPPALIGTATGEVRQVRATGGAIGWPGAGTDDVEELVLGSGDVLLLYTDGLVEARKDILDGLDSLERDLSSVVGLPVSTMTDELVRRALAGADRRDDTLALVVRRGNVVPVPEQPPVLVGHWRIEADEHAVPALRRQAVGWLRDQGAASGDLALVVAELLTNGVRAARSCVTLDLAITMSGVEVSVSDDGPGFAVLPDDDEPDLDAEGSRGLFLVRRLATGLALLPSPEGMTVRCTVPLEQAAVPDQVRRDVPSTPVL